MTKKVFLLLYFVLNTFAITLAEEKKPILTVFHNSIVFAHYDNSYSEIFRANMLYGYGVLDSSRVFIAYQPDGNAEASAIGLVIDLETGSQHEIFHLGSTGESLFQLNEDNKLIVFNDWEGIKILKIRSDNSYSINLVKAANSSTFAPFWLNSSTVGFIEYIQGKAELQTLVLTPKMLGD